MTQRGEETMKNRTIVLAVLAIIAVLAVIVTCAPAPTPVPTAAPPTTAAAAPTIAPAAAAPTIAPAAAAPTIAPAAAAPTTAPATAVPPTVAPTSAPLTKFQFRLNWTLYGEHAPFFVALDKGFYKDEGLDVEILEGSGSTTVAQLVANNTNPVAYVDAATMMRGVVAGMPIKAAGVTLQQSPMAFIYRADKARPTKIDEIKGSRIAITAGDASLAIFTAFMGKLGMKVDDVQMITVSTAAAKEQAVLNGQADSLLGYFMDQGPRMQLQSGVKMGWTRLYDMAGVTTLSSAYVVNTDWLKDPKNQDILKRFLRASQRGWQYTSDHRDEAADIFVKHAPVFTKEIAVLEISGSMTILHTKATEGKPLGWSSPDDWKDTQDLLSTYADLKPMTDLNVYFTNDYLSAAPYMPMK
jgi:NitT/TauT family transport system substrate-binding protein